VCTTSPVPVGTDLVLALGSGVMAAIAAQQPVVTQSDISSCIFGCSTRSRDQIVLSTAAMVGAGVLFLASGVTGWRWTSRCRRLQSHWDAMPIDQRETLAQEYRSNQQVERERDRAEQERLRTVAPSCDSELSAWRVERDGTWRKMQLYDRMSADCRKVADEEARRHR
jgi:hypothetical protein